VSQGFFKETDGPRHIRVSGCPSWCEPGVWASVRAGMSRTRGAGNWVRRQVGVAWSRAERKILRKRKPIPVSVWVEKHRVLTMSALPGLWRNDVTPYLPGIMDATMMPYVREVTLCKTPQTGGSEGAHNIMGYCIDRAPGPAMYIYPDEATAQENSTDRVLPMIQSSPRLRSYFTGQSRDAASFRINLQHMPIYFAWARSASRLANKPIKYAIADEIDKEGFDAGAREAHPLDLIDKRFTTYRSTYKFIKISTPTLETGNIWRSLNSCDVIFDYHVTCPLCGQRQLMTFSGIKWEGGSSAKASEIEARHLAWYECEHCQGRWDDDLRNQAARAGVWMARDLPVSLSAYLDRFRPARIGFHLPAWKSYFVSLSECAGAFLRGLQDIVKMQDFQNSYCALPWKETVIKKDEDDVLSHRNHLPAGVVPADAVALTCGIDVQQNGFWFIVKSWTKDMASHRVQYGYVSTWADVENLVFNTRYPVENTPEASMGIWRAAIDTGGGKDPSDDWSKTEEIYTWLRQHGRGVVFGVKGNGKPQVKKVNPRVIDKMSRGNRPIPGGITLYFLDTDAFKEAFFWRLGIEPGEPQAITLHADTDITYARQVLAEQKQRDKKGKVSWVPIRRDNHLLDCEIYSDACADPEWMPSLSFITALSARNNPAGQKQESPKPQRQDPPGRKKPGWFTRR
jgi:terminase, large subunit